MISNLRDIDWKTLTIKPIRSGQHRTKCKGVACSPTTIPYAHHSRMFSIQSKFPPCPCFMSFYFMAKDNKVDAVVTFKD
eukprot:3081769-Ditylum_brightwellii.AAC.1